MAPTDPFGDEYSDACHYCGVTISPDAPSIEVGRGLAHEECHQAASDDAPTRAGMVPLGTGGVGAVAGDGLVTVGLRRDSKPHTEHPKEGR